MRTGGVVVGGNTAGAQSPNFSVLNRTDCMVQSPGQSQGLVSGTALQLRHLVFEL